MKIRPLAKADYKEWRGLWVSYLDFYEASLKAEVIDETFSRFIVLIRRPKARSKDGASLELRLKG